MRDDDAHGALTRRLLLTLGTGALLASCAARGGGADATAASTEAPVTPVTTGGTRAAPKPAATPSRSAIVTRYAAARPRAWGLEVPGVATRLRGAGRAVALTFDACGGPHSSGYDAALIALLRREQVRATLFLNTRWVEANPRGFADLAADPLFHIGDHGNRHLPLSVTGRSAYGIRGTRNVGEVYDEVHDSAVRLAALARRPMRLFRSGTAHYDDVATRVVGDLGMRVVGFDVNGDAGATLSPPQVAAALSTVRPGSVVISHMNHPERGTAAGYRLGLPVLKRAGYRFVHVVDHLP